MKWVFLLIAVFGEVVATAALKASEGFTVLAPSAIVVAGYGVAFYFLSLTLDQIPVGISYALWSGIGIVLISIIRVVVSRSISGRSGAGWHRPDRCGRGNDQSIFEVGRALRLVGGSRDEDIASPGAGIGSDLASR